MIESKPFYRKLEAMFAEIDEAHPPRRFALELGPRLLQHLAGPLGIGAIHAYERDGGRFARLRDWGAGFPDLGAELAERLGRTGEEAIVEMPWAGELRVGRVGLLPVGQSPQAPLLALIAATAGELRPVPSTSEMFSALTSLRYAIEQHLRRRELEDLFDQARAVQLSLLPPGRPSFADYDIHAVSVPARSVGGDVYDFVPVDADTLAILVADASGHGLPAALQARDVVTGLRMGVEGDVRVTRLIERLNRVIHRSGLATRFVSLAFGELERNGNFAYVNAGHPPPLLADDRGIHALSVGGMILGPDPAASYKLGFAHLDRGSAMVLYSDGVVERETGPGAPFGEERLRDWLAAWRQGPADVAVADLFARLGAVDGQAFDDDVTVMLVRRPR